MVHACNSIATQETDWAVGQPQRKVSKTLSQQNTMIICMITGHAGAHL
jgi:hypothetical protein